MSESPRITQLLSFLELVPQDAFTLYSLAYEYMNLEEYEVANQYFERLHAAQPDYVGMYYHWGRCLEKMNEPEKAMSVFREGVAVAQRISDTHALAELNNTILNRELGIDD